MKAKGRRTPRIGSNAALNGILNLNKPFGWTSHDVVARVRRLSGQRRVGHAGTLDPLATGVLLVCLGTATRVSEDLMESRKTYEAVVAFGTTTTTDDAEGEVVRDLPDCHVSREDLERELGSFVGTIWQVPPAYAAIKVAGQPLYVSARRGKAVERTARRVEVFSIELLEWEPRRARLRITCGKGTYIRAIARDLGERLGCGAHLAGLVRVASGRFRLEDAVSLEVVDAATRQRALSWLLWPPDEAMLDLDAAILTDEEAVAMRQGRTLRLPPGATPRRRAYSVDGRFIGTVREVENDLWRAEKVLDG